MNNPFLSKLYKKACEEGRLCIRCKWMISKKNWKAGYRMCPGCWDAEKGVNVGGCWGKWLDEPVDKTGEMI